VLVGTAAEEQLKVAKTREDLELLWGSTDGCPAREQKPLFRPETEVEKCISFFETLTPLHFAAEMLCAALETSLGIVESGVMEVLRWAGHDPSADAAMKDGDDEPSSGSLDTPCTCGKSRNCPHAIAEAVLQDLRTLREDVLRTIADIQEDVPSLSAVMRSSVAGSVQGSGNTSPSSSEEEAVSQTLLLSIDALWESFDNLEDFEAKARILHDTFSSSVQGAAGNDLPEDAKSEVTASHNMDKAAGSEMLVALAFANSNAYSRRSSQCPSFQRIPPFESNINSSVYGHDDHDDNDTLSFKCRNAAQKDLLGHFGRHANRKLHKRHAWHSEDARELGHAAKKVVHISSSHGPGPGPGPGPGAGAGPGPGPGPGGDSVAARGEGIGHYMRAELSPWKSVARLSFRHVEK